MRPQLFAALFVLGLTLLASQSSFAYFTIGESGDLPKAGQYRIGAEPQFVFDDSGFNFSGFVDAPFRNDSSFRAIMGIGDTSFEAAISYKWIPIPDYGDQPAIGGKVEASYARKSGGNWDAIRIMPIISKDFDTVYGPITPYGSVALGLNGTPGANITTLQLVGGSEYRPPDYPRWMYSAELGLNLNNAFTYISGNVTYLLDENEVSSYKRKK
jgi:hypothetical protein